jgi:hypothetical protein
MAELKEGTYSFGLAKLHVQKREPTYNVQLWVPGSGFGPYTRMKESELEEVIDEGGATFDGENFVIPNFGSGDKLVEE